MLKKSTVSQQQTLVPVPALKLPARVWHWFWGRFLDVWFWLELGGGLLFLATLGGFFGRWSWISELLAHWRWQYTLGAAALALVFAGGRRIGPMAGMLFVAGINGMLLLPFFTAVAAPPAGDTLRVVSLNVWLGNRDLDPIFAFLEEADPDVIILSEVTWQMIPVFQSLQDEYPCLHDAVAADRTARLVLSRVPNTTLETVAGGRRPSVAATISVGGQPVTIIGVHTASPARPASWQARNEQFDDLARYVQTQQQPVLLFGDLNISPWSPFFNDLRQDTGLRDGRAGFGIQPTWPASWGRLGIPIDHALVSPQVVVHSFHSGPNVGSDHRAIIVDFSVSGE